ncbi:hypothetical protein D6_0057 [Aeromonas phage D6]|uniref:Uncharacterized protein n=2 Tax=Ludhianavirus TaxID=3044751 RepID=A0A514A192_9CAUD|nr:hypothetical protein PQC06_gp224 [Aeromonas phage LAh10]YP_010668805.1 hypothetical protein PQC08_gp218 [Aeromonas phage D6]QDH47047.1 hypothetical protein LAh10_223 [Aeromonas phage LAh10]QDJ97217.1 hypothetical protein D6_0057 [Aeromonas phage D6]
MLQLIEVKCGLTNFYPDQVIRNNEMNLNNEIINDMVRENLSGGVTPSTLLHGAALCGGLSAQATDWGQIYGGWNDSKGLMLMKFVQEGNNPVMVEYVHVMGYIHSNNSQGLDRNAIFVPQYSWRTTERVTAGATFDMATNIKRTLSHRTDYLINDTYRQEEIVTLRPTDVLDGASNLMCREDTMRLMEQEGLESFDPQTIVAGSSVKRVGVVPSTRSNLNPSAYATECLGGALTIQNNTRNYQPGWNGTEMSGNWNTVAEIGAEMRGREPLLTQDEFFRDVRTHSGAVVDNGFGGFSIGDLEVTYPNFEDVLDLTLYDAEMYQQFNYTETSEAMGTSQLGEFVSQEIMMNIMDLMAKNDLAAIKLRGSNCDYQNGDGHLSNVNIIPYDGVSLKDDDFNLGYNMKQLVASLTTQIFVKLNGVNPSNLVPLRFSIEAELMGTCNVSVQIVDMNNASQHFDMAESGNIVGMVNRSFPTFAINNYSSIIGTSDTALQGSQNFLNNVSSYFN